MLLLFFYVKFVLLSPVWLNAPERKKDDNNNNKNNNRKTARINKQNRKLIFNRNKMAGEKKNGISININATQTTNQTRSGLK